MRTRSQARRPLEGESTSVARPDTEPGIFCGSFFRRRVVSRGFFRSELVGTVKSRNGRMRAPWWRAWGVAAPSSSRVEKRWTVWRRYACVRQSDQSDRGAAALATIALHYRRPIGVQQLRDLAGTDRVGTNLLGLLQAAEQLSFSAKGVKGPYEALPGVPLPAIAHVRTEEGLGHFVVLHRVAKQS